MRTIKKILGDKKTFWIIIAVFLFQVVWFAGSIRRNIPPDEGYHVSLIQYYSQQPVSSGPFIHHQTSQSFSLGDIERTPNYMYHYALGSIIKVSNHFIHSDTGTVYFLRVVNVLMALAGLLVLRKLFDELKVSRVYQNATFALMTFTTMFVAIAAAVNYDNAIFLIMSLFLLALFRFTKRYSATDFMWLIIVGSLGLLVKYQFVVIVVASVVVILARAIADKKMLSGLGSSFRKKFIKQRLTSIILVALVILSLGMVVERYGVNVVRYHAISPSCASLHTEQLCGLNMVYKRDSDQKIAFDNFIKNGGQVIYAPFTFAGEWASQMYSTLFFYLGQNFTINPTKRLQNLVASFVVVSAAAILMYYKRGRVLTSRYDKELMFIAAFYVMTLFLFNLSSYLHSGSYYGFQGRYLLPVMPLVFLFFARAFGSACKTLVANGRRFTVYGLVALVLLIGYLQMPILVFYRGTNPTWYSEPTSHINTKILNGFIKLRVTQGGLLPGSNP